MSERNPVEEAVAAAPIAVTESVRRILDVSKQVAAATGYPAATCSHVLLALLETRQGRAFELLAMVEIDSNQLRERLQQQLGLSAKQAAKQAQSSRATELGFHAEVAEALQHALRLSENVVTSSLLLYGVLLTNNSSASRLLHEMGLTEERMQGILNERPDLAQMTGGYPMEYALTGGPDGYLPDEPDLVAEPEEAPTAEQQAQVAGEARPADAATAPLRTLNEDDVFIQDNEEPAIGATDIAAEMCSLIRNLRTSDRGKMVGVFGAWGRGKTFLIELIRKRLGGFEESNFHQVTFHAWKYQDTPASWAYLYEAFANAYFADEPGNSRWSAFWRRTRRVFRLNTIRNGYYTPVAFGVGIALLLGAVAYGWRSGLFQLVSDKDKQQYWAVAALGVLLPVSIGLITFVRNTLNDSYNSALTLFNKYYRKSSMEHLLGVQAEVQKELRCLFQAWLGKQPEAKVLLIVDDIDRCNEQKVIQIIDALRVMLEERDISDRVVVLAAIDERILKNAVKRKYQEFFQGVRAGDQAGEEYRVVSEYLDKLFISGVRLGPLSSQEMSEVFAVYSKHHIEPNVGAEEPAKKGAAAASSAGLGQSEQAQSITSSSTDPVAQPAAPVSVPVTDAPATAAQPESAAGTPAPKTSYALSVDEAEFIKALLMRNNVQMTPRQIRVYYYRYLLARNMLLKRLKTIAVAADKNVVKQTLLRVLLHYFFLDNTTLAEAKQQAYYSSPMQDYELKLPDIPAINIDRKLMLEIYSVSELVTGY